MHFGSSGIRETVTGEFLETAYRLGLSLGKGYRNVVVGGDTRTSTPALKHALLAGLLAAGARARDAGTLPTPSLAFVARHFDAAIMVTASHNPPEYNGVKLWNPDGSAFSDTQRSMLERSLASPYVYPNIVWEGMTESHSYPLAVEEHLERVLSDFPGKFNLKVVVDAGGGATSHVTPYLLGRMGCQVVSINCQPTGLFPRPSEPSPENLATLTQVVTAVGADLGLAHDGDGDRLVAVDEHGRVVPGDKLLVLIARFLHAKKVVTTVDASMAIEQAGFQTSRTRVGDAFVSQELKEGGDFGGEAAGAWIFPRVSLCPDGVYAAAVAVSIASQGKLSQQVDAIPSYPLLRVSFPASSSLLAAIDSELMKLEPASVTRLDGLRLDMGDGWLLVRPSGTEPKLRLTAEAISLPRARELLDGAIRIIESCRQKTAAGAVRP
ncbi:MAG: phosphoglucosamine mutase [Chloroflexi bacterium]|nr:phosphoglucosamine mutase [Chloroflexota bacterium]